MGSLQVVAPPDLLARYAFAGPIYAREELVKQFGVGSE